MMDISGDVLTFGLGPWHLWLSNHLQSQAMSTDPGAFVSDCFWATVLFYLGAFLPSPATANNSGNERDSLE